MGTIVHLDLMGGVALLLWGLHRVQSGIMRAFSSDLRRLLARALRNRFVAFGGGLACPVQTGWHISAERANWDLKTVGP